MAKAIQNPEVGVLVEFRDGTCGIIEIVCEDGSFMIEVDGVTSEFKREDFDVLF